MLSPRSRFAVALNLASAAILLACGSFPAAFGADWQPATGPLATRWAKDVSPERVHPEYPRPQFARSAWLNLNGLWDYAITPKAADKPAEYQGQLLVPFPVESALSGVMKRVDDQQRLWYRRSVEIPKAWVGQRVMLHFGAVDWETSVWVNGVKLGDVHKGGYDPFSFDITDQLKPNDAKQEIIVGVWDPTDKGTQPRGKQVQKPGGIFYTPTTGIWQTVWLEPVPKKHIATLKITSELDQEQVRIEIVMVDERLGIGSSPIAEVALDGQPLALKFEHGPSISEEAGVQQLTIIGKFPKGIVKPWTPEKPTLYSLRITAPGDKPTDKPADVVDSYFGMRKIALGRDPAGVTRIMLNNEPVFQYGPLDQGFWPDGLYTAPTDEALRYDIEITKQLGFNMARKHVKVEPDRWYYWCDKLGLLVWQDMPSGDASVAPDKGEIKRTPESAAQYEHELKRMIETLWNHPSIVMWVPFNEGWGQFDTMRIVPMVKKLDPTRLVDCASGWNDMPTGDVHDFHVYPGPASPQPEEHRAAVLGEFGGLGLPVRGHTWQSEKNWGYRSFTDSATLTEAYRGIVSRMHPMVRSPGLSAAVYTQTTDVEVEVNGLLTYDRAQIKLNADLLTAANRKLYQTPPIIKPLVATSREKPHTWRYTFETPSKQWFESSFDDAAWKEGPAGFGTKGTPGAVVRTTWSTPDIWLRRQIELPELSDEELAFIVNHDEDVSIYVNGVLAATADGYNTGYDEMPLNEAGRKAIRAGKNTLAAHCKQTGGGQAIDVGLAAKISGEVGWKSLFDGKTLGDWKVTEFAGHNDVEVKDGALLLGMGNNMTGITWKGADIPKMNYEISVDAKRVDGNDFFCGLTFPYGDSPCSLILGGWGGSVVGLSSINGRDASENTTTKYRGFTKGRWYHVKLRVTEHAIEAWLDDELIVDADTTGQKISIRPEVELNKPLGFSSYTTTAALKNIKVRSLDKKPAQAERKTPE